MHGNVCILTETTAEDGEAGLGMQGDEWLDGRFGHTVLLTPLAQLVPRQTHEPSHPP